MALSVTSQKHISTNMHLRIVLHPDHHEFAEACLQRVRFIIIVFHYLKLQHDSRLKQFSQNVQKFDFHQSWKLLVIV